MRTDGIPRFRQRDCHRTFRVARFQRHDVRQANRLNHRLHVFVDLVFVALVIDRESGVHHLLVRRAVRVDEVIGVVSYVWDVSDPKKVESTGRRY